MKRILLITAFLCITTIQVFAQNNNQNRIKALKTAFISNAVDLSSAEAEKFWPIYNTYSKTIRKEKIAKTRMISNKIKDSGGIDKLSDAEANSILQQFIDIDFKVANAKKELSKNLTGIISSKKIIKLFKAEQDFNKELLKRFKDRKKRMEQRRN